MTAPRDDQILLRVGGLTWQQYGVPWRRRRWAAAEPEKPAFTRADASPCATLIDHNGIVRTAPANVPRIQWVDLDGDGIRETPGILLEGSRTNAFTRSEEFDHGDWSKVRCSVTPNATTAPDGTMTADKLVEDSTTGVHRIERNTPALADNVGQPWTVFVKAAERTWCELGFMGKDGTFRTAYFNLSAGVWGGISSGAAVHAERLADAWYRLAIMCPSASGATQPFVRIAAADGDGVESYAGDGTSGIYVWGGMFEPDLVFPSSYIKTVASSVSRAADSFTIPVGFGPVDITVLAIMARPAYADLNLSGITSPRVYRLGYSSTPAVGLALGGTTVQAIPIIDSTGTDAQIGVSLPAGASLAIAVQFKHLTTGGVTRADASGAGYSADSSAASPFSAYGAQTLRVGGGSGTGQEFYGVLVDLLFCRDLFARADMLAAV